MDKSLLEPFSLNDSEWSLYQAVLEAGGLSSTALAKVTKLKRTTAYSVARSLTEKGLIVEDNSVRPMVFRLADAERINQLIEQEKDECDRRLDSYKRIAAELSKLQARENYPVPTVQFVPEEKIKTFLDKRAPVWDKSAIEIGETTWWGFQDHTFLEVYRDWIDRYWKSWDQRMDIKLLSNHSKSEAAFAKQSKYQERRNIKYWGEALDFHSTTMIAGNYIVMINTRSKPFYLVEIHDKLMAHDQREVFRSLWEMVK